MQSERRLPTLFRSVQFRHGRETIFRKRTVQTAFFCHSQKASMWTLGQESKSQHVAPSDLVFLFFMGAGLSYQRKHTSELELGWPPLMCSNSAPGANWETTSPVCFSPRARHKTDALPVLSVLLPVSGVSKAILKPYALLDSL